MTGRPRKRFGQHFLRDTRIIARIVDLAAGDRQTPVVEIGPGKGALTLPLAGLVPVLHLLEIDRDLAAGLSADFSASPNVTVHCVDALGFDFSSIRPAPIRVVGNLPYNISTPLLFHLLRHAHHLQEMIVMLQLEVANRLCARAGGADYGRLTIMVQSQCRAEKLFSVPAGAFHPAPRVESAVVRLRPAPGVHGAIADPALFSRIVQEAFSGRRKMLRNALRSIVQERGIPLNELGLDDRRRPETLTVGEFVRLANCLSGMRGECLVC